MTPEEILHHAYEYTTREDILLGMEGMELSRAQTGALLTSPSPLRDIYSAYTKIEIHTMDYVRECIDLYATDQLEVQRALPVYRYPSSYAAEHEELEQYRASRKANIACAAAIDAAISEYYRDNHLDREAILQVVEQFGYDRMLYVLTNTVCHKEQDGCISRDNKAWAKTIPVFEDPDAWENDRNTEFNVNHSHPGLINLFVDMARHEHLMAQPFTRDDICTEAARILSAFQAEREPNSPHRTHFMAQVDPNFLARASTKDHDRLMAMLPFYSLTLSGLEGRKGVYALIAKDGDRTKPLRQCRPSVRRKLSETKAESGHRDKKKPREQER